MLSGVIYAVFRPVRHVMLTVLQSVVGHSQADSRIGFVLHQVTLGNKNG